MSWMFRFARVQIKGIRTSEGPLYLVNSFRCSKYESDLVLMQLDKGRDCVTGRGGNVDFSVSD